MSYFHTHMRRRAVAAALLLVALALPSYAAPGCINSGDFSFGNGSTFDVEIDGTTPCTGHDQRQVTGTVTIDTGASLNLSGTHVPTVGDNFIIIDNDDTDTVTGNFNGLPDGATISNFLGSGLVARISYQGGTGNDVEITVEAGVGDPVAAAITADDITIPGAYFQSIEITYTDDTAIADATIGTGNITVIGPGGPLTIDSSSSDAPEDVSPKTATYEVVAPGGSWDAADNGTYTIGIVGSQVADTGGAFVPANSTAATFEVIIAPDIAISGNGVDIANGDSSPSLADHTDFGGTETPLSRTFTVHNTGTIDLALTGGTPVTISGPGAGSFSVTAQPSSPVTAGSTTTFTIEFTPSGGVSSATISIASDDPDEAPFTFAVSASDGFPARISEAVADGDAVRPATAYGQGLGIFLVVWDQPDGIYGQFVTESGAVGPDFEISTNPVGPPTPQRGFPDVVFNVITQQWLVVWQENNAPGAATEYEIMAQLIDVGGNKLSPPPVRISEMGTDGVSTADAFEPAVAYDVDNNQFLVVWSGDDGVDGDEEIYGQLLEADLVATGPDDFRISTTGTDGDASRQAQLPDVIYNGNDGVFIVAWEGDGVTDEAFAISAQVVGSNGALGAPVVPVGAAPAHDVALVLNNDTNDFLAVWEGAVQIQGQFIADDGTPVGGPIQVSNMAVEGLNPALEAFSTRGEIYVFWEGDNGGELEIYRQNISGSGALLGPVQQVSDQGPASDANFAAQTPAVAKGQDILVVWSGDTNEAPLADEQFEIFGDLSIVPPNLLINEVDVDQDAVDGEEFVELRNMSGSPLDLSDWELRVFGGANISLPNVVLANQDYFVISTDATRVPNTDLDAGGPDLLPDSGGIALFFNGIVADALGWNGFATAPYVEGTATDADPGVGQAFTGLSRLPVNAQNNVQDFGVRCITPGADNTADDTGCTNPIVANLAISGTDLPDPVGSGQALTYTLTVNNAGPDTAVDVAVTINVPAGLGFVSASGAGWTCVEAAGIVTCTLPSLALGSAGPISIIATYNGSVSPVVAAATVNAWSHDPDLGDNTVNFSTVGGAEIQVTGNGNDIANGSGFADLSNHTEFETITFGDPATERTFTVHNLGGQPLTLDAASLATSLSGSTEFNLLASFGSTTLSANDNAGGGPDETTFRVAFTPTAVGVHNHSVSFANSDTDENSFIFVIAGTALDPPVDTGDGVAVSEDGLTDTYTLRLPTNPAGAVDITTSADAQSEVSSDGVNFFASITTTHNDTTPQVITVRAIDDAAIEGPHTSTISHAITTTNDPADYPLSYAIDDVVADVGDNDGPDITVFDVTRTFEILNGDTTPDPVDGTDFGGSRNLTTAQDFQISNVGTTDLIFPANAISFSGVNADKFVATVQPPTTLAANSDAQVTIRFEPTAAGVHTATVEIASNDTGESPYQFTISAASHQKLIVTTLVDEDDGTVDASVGDGTSLREAISFANSAPGLDAICFQNGLSGSIFLADRLPIITEGLTIDGDTDGDVNTVDVGVDGSSAYRVFQVDDANLTITNLLIENAYADGSDGSGFNGGGIWADHSTSAPLLRLDYVSFLNNTADAGGAVYLQNGTLDISNCLFEGNSSGSSIDDAGGAIRAVSTLPDLLNLQVQTTTFRNNAAATVGGAISADAIHFNLDLDYTLFEGNTSGQQGAAVHLTDSDGATGLHALQIRSSFFQFHTGGTAVDAVLAGPDRLEVHVEQSSFFNNNSPFAAGAMNIASGLQGNFNFSNTTFSDNTVSGTESIAGALAIANATATLTSCSIHNNLGVGSNTPGFGVAGGVDAAGGILLLNNTMLADNSGTTVDEIRMRGGAFIDANYNFVRGSTDGAALTAPNNILGQDPDVDPLTGGLNIGAPGDGTPMLILEPRATSPLINAGDTAFNNDQIGNARPIGGGDDIGAIESTRLGELQISGSGSIITNGAVVTTEFDDTDFGDLSVATGSVAHTFSIEGLGPFEVNLTGTPLVAITGPHVADFTVTADPSDLTLTQGEITTFDITFDPSGAGIRTATVSVASTDPDDNPYTFAISGNGSISLIVEESSGTTNVTEGGATDTVTVRLDSNPAGTVTVDVQPGGQLDAGAGGGTIQQLFFTDTTPQIVTISAVDDLVSEGPHSDTINYGVSSSAPETILDGGFVTTVNITDNDAAIVVSGNGQVIPNRAVDFSFNDHTDFGATRSGSGQVQRTYSITNLSDANLTFGTVTISGPAAGDFTILQQPVGPVGLNGTTTLIIAFTASVDGSRDATVNIPNSDPDETPFTFDISGYGNGNDIVFVDSNATGTNDGSSFVNAFVHLQDALDFSDDNPVPVGINHIWVAGTHRPDQSTANPGGTGDINAAFTLLDLNMLGGFNGRQRFEHERNTEAWPTVLSGNVAGGSVAIATGDTTGATALVDGFRFEDGQSQVRFNGGEATIRGSVFTQSAGSAVSVAGGSPLLVGCTWVDSVNGLAASGGTPELRDCRFLNLAVGVSVTGADVTVSNSIFSGSNLAITGAAGAVTVTNCSFANNTTALQNAGATLFVANSITAGNGMGLDATSGTTTAFHSNFAEAPVAGTANISADPLFVDADGADNTPGTPDDDLRLNPGSPSIDSGLDAAAASQGLSADLDGNARISDDTGTTNGVGGSVDMGAYEFQGTTPSGIAIVGNGADIANGDVTPDRADHTDFLAANMGSAPTRTFTIENRSTAQLNISSIAISGAGDFTITNSGLNILNPGASTTFTIEFAPTTTGVRPATVQILSSDAANSPYTFAIVGGGTNGVTFVNRNVVGGAGDGSSWIDAMSHLQDALTAGATNIWAAGTHRPDEDAANPNGTGDTSAVFTLGNSEIIRGGFGGWEHSAADANPALWPTILTGDLNEDDPTLGDNSNRIVNSVTGPTLQNLTVSAAVDSAISNNGSLTMRDVIVRDSGGVNGGAILNSGGIVATACRFINNSAAIGGAIWNNGGAEFDSCRFEGNSANDGGALHNIGGTDLENCVFVGNQAANAGGAVWNESGGGTSALNCTFADNQAGGSGGAVRNDDFFGVDNSIFAFNTAAADPHIGDVGIGTLTATTYSSFTGSALAGPGNIVADPLFVNLAAGDVSLQSTSPCIDAGDNDPIFAANLATDFAGDDRIQDLSAAPNTGNGGVPIVDMGAYEHPGNVLIDFGDAPATYGTRLVDDGARHVITGPVLGATVDPNNDGQPGVSADGDDADGNDDEDGITVLSAATPNQSVDIQVTVSLNPGILNVWVDGNQDGDFFDAGEQVVTDHSVGVGLNTVAAALPAAFAAGNTIARYRIDSAGGLGPVGPAFSGEVEDHPFVIVNAAPIAVDDTASVAHNASVSGDVLANDNDPNSTPLVVSAVNGGGANVGTTITIGSGAQVTVGTNGGFTYDTNGAWNHLTVGQTAIDSFAYTASDSIDTDSANVVVTVVGVSLDRDAVVPGIQNGVPDDFVIFRDGTEIVVTRNGDEVVRQEDADLDSVTINGSNDDDSLTIDYAGGDPLSGMVSTTFNGVFGTNPLTITGPLTTQGIHYTATGTNGYEGFAMLDGARLNFTGVTDVAAGEALDTNIFLQDAATTATLQPGAPGSNALTGNTLPPTAIPNPGASLTLTSGSAGTALSINALDPAYAADLAVVDGAGPDTVGIDATLRTNGGTLHLNADDITVTRTIQSAGGDVELYANNTVTLAGSTGDIATGGGNFEAIADFDVDGNGVYQQSSQGSSVQAGAGTVTVEAADFALGGVISGVAVSLAPRDGQSIDLGAGAGADILITDIQVDRIGTPDLVIGSAATAYVSINSTVDPANATNLTILSDGPILGNAPVLDLVVPALTLVSSANISDDVSPIDVETGSITASTGGNVYITNGLAAIADITAGNDISLEVLDLDIANLDGAGLLDISPRAASTTIGLGGATGDLDLDDADLANITANFAEIVIGGATTTLMTVETATFQSIVNLIADRIVDTANPLDVVLAPGTALFLEGTVAPGASPGIFGVDGHVELVTGSTLEIEMQAPGATAGTDFDRLVADSATIQPGVTLDASWTGAAPTPGQPIHFLATTTARTGEFDGLPDNASYFTNGHAFHIDYDPANGSALVANIPPQASDDSVNTVVGVIGTVDVLANDTDADTAPFGDTLEATKLDGSAANLATAHTLASNAIVTLLSDGSFSYNPNGQFSSLDAGDTATDSVSYTIADNLGGTSVATVHIIIHGASDPPVAGDDAINANEDALATGGGLLGNDSDPEGNPFAVSSHDVSSALNANVTVDAAGNYSYNPRVSAALQTLALGSSGTDSFTYTISDGTGSDSATVVVTVQGANDAPVATADSANAQEDSIATLTGLLDNDNDVDVGDTLSTHAEILASARGATITTDANGGFNYNGTGVASLQALAAGETATDTFIYTMSDNNGATDQATVTVTVTGENDAPVAGDDSPTVNEDSTLNGTGLLANDTDTDTNDTHTADVAAGTSARGANYTVAANGDFTYDGGTAAFAQPLNLGDTMTDTFTYIVRDNNNGTDQGTVVVIIHGTNDAPVAVADTANVQENGFLAGQVLSSNDTDIDNALLTVSAADANSARGVTIGLNPDGSFVYDISAVTTFDYLATNAQTTDQFTYAAFDGTATNRGTVTITITGINDPVTANDDSFSTREDNSLSGLSVLANDDDPDVGDTLRIQTSDTVSALGAHVAVNPVNGTFLYDPRFVPAIAALNTGQTLVDTFTYQATDNRGTFDNATVSVTVHGQTDQPLANIGGPYNGLEGTPLTVSAAGSTDPNNDITDYLWDFDNDGSYDDASGVTVSFNNPQDGLHTINLLVRDATGLTDTDTTTVTLSNVAPIADAGGPYVGGASTAIPISGSASIDPGQDIVSFDWDLDNDGIFETLNTENTTFTSAFGATFPIHLRVTDANGESSSDTTTVITNLSITWENLVGVATFGSQQENLRKTVGGSWGSASASSVQSLDEDGYLKVDHNLSNGRRMIGLSTTEHGSHFNTIEYALYLNFGNLEIFESGVHRGGFGPSLGEELRIEIANGDIIYWRGTTELRRVVGAVSEPFSFVADASLDTLGATIEGAELVVPPPQRPQIVTYSSTDPDNGNTFYSAGDQVCVEFHQKTNMGGYALNQPLSKGQIDDLITFIPPPGNAYTGYWSAKDKLVIDIVTVSPVEPQFGAAICIPTGTTPIVHDKAPALQAVNAVSPGLSGDWGSVFVKWIQGVNVRIDGNYLARATPLPNNWNAGAVSSREIPDGDIYVETEVTARGKHRMIGFSSGNPSEHFSDMSHAFFLHRAGGLEIYENGIQAGSHGSYDAGDLLRIEIVGDTLRYIKNGSTVLREVTIDPLTFYPARVDTSINDNGGDFDQTVLVIPDPPPPAIDSFVASDPDDDVITYNVGDVFTINFTHPTTMPAADIDDLFTFSQPLGATLTGGWLDNQTYQVVVVATGVAPTIGVATVAPAGTIPIYHENSRVIADNTPATLSGNYGRPRNKITVAQAWASSTSSGSAQALVDGSGLSADQHGTNASDMWLSDIETDPSVTIDLGRSYFVSEMAVWNYNASSNGALGFTATTIEHSSDGTTWTTAFTGNIPQAAGNSNITPTRYFTLDANARYVRLSATGDGPLGLSEICVFSDAALPPFRWDDPGLRTTIADSKLIASFQAGHLYQLQNRGNGDVLLQNNPTTLPPVIGLFGATNVDLSTAVVNVSATPTSATINYLWLDGSSWTLDWSFNAGDLVLSTSAVTLNPVQEMALNLIGADIANHSAVSIDSFGTSHEMSAPFTGPQWLPGDSQPSIALFDRGTSAWVVDGRGTGYIHPTGAGTTANLAVSHPQAATTTPSIFDIRIRCGADWQTVAQPHRDWFVAQAPAAPPTAGPHICHSLVANGAGPNTTIGPLDSAIDIGDAFAQGVGPIIADLNFVPNAMSIGADIFYVRNLVDLPTVAAAHPGVPLMSEGFNPDSIAFADTVLITGHPGHPLSGYLFSPLVSFFTNGPLYAPTSPADLDAHIRWPYFVPGSDPSQAGDNSWGEILDIFHQHNLVSDTAGGYQGDLGVTAQWVSTGTTRSLQLNPAGTLHGTRYTNLQQLDLGGGAIEGWLAYNGTGMFGLNPARTYYVDPNLVLDPLAFHIDTAPGDFIVQDQTTIAEFNRVEFTGNGILTYVLPGGFSAILDTTPVAGPTPIAGAHTLRAFAHAPQFIEGLWTSLTVDGDPLRNGAIRGRFPAGATEITVRGDAIMTAGTARLTVNGIEIFSTNTTYSTDIDFPLGFDLIALAGEDVVVDLQVTGDAEFDSIIFGVTAPPVADIGGPYTTPEGSGITLDASNSYPNGVTTAWELDNDGDFNDAFGQTANFATTQSGVYPIGVRVTAGTSDETFSVVTVTNVTPTADAGGPYLVAPGDGVTLDGTNSNDPGFDIRDYEWDFDGDGVFDDATGPSPVFVPTGSGTIIVNLRVTDDDNASSTSTATVFASNDVEWTNFVNAEVQGDCLVKIGGGSAWNAGASTVTTLNEDGYLGIDATRGGKRMIGLTTSDNNAHLSDIEYAFYMNQSAIEIYESGVQRGSFGTFNEGADLRIYLERGDVYYTIDGVEVRRNIGVIPLDGFSFVADASIETINADVCGVRLVTPPPESPRIILYEGTDPDNLGTAYEADDAVNIVFHQKTDRAGFAIDQVLDRATIDQLFAFSTDPGDDYDGRWISDDTFQIRIVTPAAVPPAFGTDSAQVAGGIVINNSKVALPADPTPATLTGHWGTVVVLWTNPVKVIVDGNKLTRPTSSEGWDGGAASSRTFTGDGYMETIAETTGKNRMIGFSDGDDNQHFSSLNFAFFMHFSGGLEVYENGSSRGRLTTYGAGDVLRLERSGTDMLYMVNGLVYRTTPVSATLGLKVDCSIYSRGSVINNTRLVLPGDPLPRPARAESTDAVRSAATILLDSGWNLVSIPVNPDDSDATSVFGGPVHDIDGPVDSLQGGGAYWVFNAGDARSVVITGEVQSASSLPGSGWNLFGPVADFANPAALEGATIYSFENGAYRQIDSSDILEATRGYLIHQD